jgi:hypothetical protein
MRQKFAQVLDQIFIADIALVGVVQETLKAVQYDVEARPVSGGNACTQMVKQRFDFAPVYIAADRVMENGKQQAVMLVTHGSSPLTIASVTSIIPCCGLVKGFNKYAFS